jgi:hypothetical protein
MERSKVKKGQRSNSPSLCLDPIPGHCVTIVYCACLTPTYFISGPAVSLPCHPVNVSSSCPNLSVLLVCSLVYCSGHQPTASEWTLKLQCCLDTHGFRINKECVHSFLWARFELCFGYLLGSWCWARHCPVKPYLPLRPWPPSRHHRTNEDQNELRWVLPEAWSTLQSIKPTCSFEKIWILSLLENILTLFSSWI